MNNYPATVDEILSDDYQFKKGTVTALKLFKKQRTYKYPTEVRLAGMRLLVVRICKVHGIQPPKVLARNIDGSFSGSSSYSFAKHEIVMQGKLSIITLLHELAHCIYGASETQAVRWSVNLFRQVYPEQYANLTHQGHCLVRQ